MTMILWRRCATLLLFLLPCAFAQGQRTIPPIATAPPPRAPGPNVQLDVLVLDGGGNPVSGLAQKDFTVRDDTQPQTIADFAPAGVAGQSPAEAVLVLDAVNTGFSNVSYAREEMDKFLKANGGKLPLPVSVAVFTDAGVTMLNGSPSEDGNALAAMLDGKQTGLRTIRRSMGFYGASDRLGISLHGLSNVADYEAPRPGRKLVIWVSPGWPYLSGPGVQLSSGARESLFRSVVNLSTAMREARITLYSVDPLGAADSASFRNFYYQSFLKPVRKSSQVEAGNLSLGALAVQSGGRVLNATNDISREIAGCLREAAGFYSLSFRGPPAESADEFHAVEVKVDKPGFSVRTRNGYYGAPAAALPR